MTAEARIIGVHSCAECLHFLHLCLVHALLQLLLFGLIPLTMAHTI